MGTLTNRDHDRMGVGVLETLDRNCYEDRNDEWQRNFKESSRHNFKDNLAKIIFVEEKHREFSRDAIRDHQASHLSN